VLAAASVATPAWIQALLTAPLASAHEVLTAVRGALHLIADKTGVPIVVVTAVVLVAAFRLARRSGRFVLEVALVLMLLVVATKLGFIVW
jgi:hypothetical protein